LVFIQGSSMKKNIFEKSIIASNSSLFIIGVCILSFFLSCAKKNSAPTIPWNGNLVAYAPVPVTKGVSKKVFVHYMPWFETPITSSNDAWGEHWTMTNQFPPATIASYYYPLNTLYYSNGSYINGPYGTSDTALIDYQLLLMKLSGIDGVFIDWPGTLNHADFQKNVANSNAVIARLAKVGLQYAIVYEDQNLQYVAPSTQANQIAQAQADMLYIQNNYFKDTATATYATLNGKPLLLDFGPFNPPNSPLNTNAEWNTVFSVFTTTPAYVTYEYQSNKSGSAAIGELAWVQSTDNSLSNVTSFYNYAYSGTKIAAAFPGFKAFYAAGGESGPTWTIPTTGVGTGATTFASSLDLAIQQPGDYIQVVTWNDYGEGTDIEPTTQFQYSYLTTLQQHLQVQSLSQSDLEAVAKLYKQRLYNILPAYNQSKLDELNQVYYYMVALKMDSAKGMLNNF